MPVMITLNKLLESQPSIDGWEKVLKAHKHLGMNTQFPLCNVLDCSGLHGALKCFEALPEHIEILKRFALWCVQDISYLMMDDSKDIEVLEVAERYLDGNATRDELEDLYDLERTHIVNTLIYCLTDESINDTITDVAYIARDVIRTVEFVENAATHCGSTPEPLDTYQKQIDKLREMLDAA